MTRSISAAFSFIMALGIAGTIGCGKKADPPAAPAASGSPGAEAPPEGGPKVQDAARIATMSKAWDATKECVLLETCCNGVIATGTDRGKKMCDGAVTRYKVGFGGRGENAIAEFPTQCKNHLSSLAFVEKLPPECLAK